MNIRHFLLYPQKSERILQHILFWLLVFLFKALSYGSFYAYDPKNISSPMISASLDILAILPFIIIFSYFTYYIIFKQYVFHLKFKEALILLLLTGSVATITLRAVLFFTINPEYNSTIYDTNFFDILQLAGIIVEIYQIFFAFLSLALLRKMIVNFLNEKKQRLDIEKKSEIQFQQLNNLKNIDFSHILFNNLNNLYALSLEKSNQTSDYILALSTLINFILFEQFKDKTPVNQLIESLESYFNIEKIRFGEKFKWNFTYKTKSKSINHPLIIFQFIHFIIKHSSENSLSPNISVSLNEDNKRINVTALFMCNKEISEIKMNKLKQILNQYDNQVKIEFNYNKNKSEYMCLLQYDEKFSYIYNDNSKLQTI